MAFPSPSSSRRIVTVIRADRADAASGPNVPMKTATAYRSQTSPRARTHFRRPALHRHRPGLRDGRAAYGGRPVDAGRGHLADPAQRREEDGQARQKAAEAADEQRLLHSDAGGEDAADDPAPRNRPP